MNENKVNMLTALLYSDAHLKAKACELLQDTFGEIDYVGKAYSFTQTEYYSREMGNGLQRCFVSFRNLIDASSITGIKIITAEIEKNFLSSGLNRHVNIDPGYIDYSKLILASFKYGGQKVYLGEAIWADPVLHYSKNEWISFPWTFPDFSEKTYHEDLTYIRDLYRIKMKKIN